MKRFFAVSFLFFSFFSPSSGAQSDSIKILVLGDSLTEGYGVKEEQAYASIMAKKLKQNFPNKPIEVIKNGVNGATSASALGRLKWQLRAPQLPKILILALGANDGLRGLEPVMMGKNLSSAIELAQKKGIVVILTGMMALPNYGKKYAQEYAATFPKLQAKYNLILMPFLLESVAGEAKYNISDGVHPNPLGHEIIADNLYPWVLQAIQSIN